jgi:hypothetical protein
MQDVVETLAGRTGISGDQAEGAIRIVLNFLHTDGPAETVERLAAELGVADYLGTPAKAGGGLIGALGGLFGGGAMAAFGELQALGLDFDQIQLVVRDLIGIGREKVGDAEVDRILDAIPGLARLI